MTSKTEIESNSTDFSHFKNLAIDSAITAEYPIYEVSVNDVSPVLFVKTASVENAALKKALVRKAGKAAQMALARGKLPPDFIEENREEKRELFAKHVIVGWKDMYDAQGNEVVHSLANARELVQSLPSWMFDELTAFCENVDNFNGEGHIEVSAKAKKSAKTLPGT